MANENPIQHRLLTIKQAAEYLAVCERSLWNLFYSGRIKPVKIGKIVRVDQNDLDSLINAAKGLPA